MPTETAEQKKAIPAVSVDTLTIAKRLRTLTPGESITYDQIKALVPGRQINGKDAYLLQSAKKLLCHEGIVIETVFGQGVKRLVNGEIAALHDHARKRVRRISSRTMRKMVCAEYDKLTDAEKRTYNAGLATLGTLKLFSEDKSQRVIEAAVTQANAKISFDETLKLFAK